MTKKKDKKNNQFPKISRPFTEHIGKLTWDRKKYLVYAFTILFFLFILFMAFDVRQKIAIANDLEVERKQLLKDINKWEEIVDEHKDYRDGYLKLSILEYKLGNLQKAKNHLNKAFEIDPNSKTGLMLKEILE